MLRVVGLKIEWNNVQKGSFENKKNWNYFIVINDYSGLNNQIAYVAN